MIESVTEETHGSDCVPDLNTDLRASLWLAKQHHPRAKWRSSRSACSSVLANCLTRADIAKDAMLRQLSRVERGDTSNAIRQQPESHSRRRWASGSYQPLSAAASPSATRSRAMLQPLAK